MSLIKLESGIMESACYTIFPYSLYSAFDDETLPLLDKYIWIWHTHTHTHTLDSVILYSFFMLHQILIYLFLLYQIPDRSPLFPLYQITRFPLPGFGLQLVGIVLIKKKLDWKFGFYLPPAAQLYCLPSATDCYNPFPLSQIIPDSVIPISTFTHFT